MPDVCEEVEYSVLRCGPRYVGSSYVDAFKEYKKRYYTYTQERNYTDLAEKPRMFKSIITTTEYEWDVETGEFL